MKVWGQMLSVTGFKLLAMASVIIISLVGSLLPLRLKSFLKIENNVLTWSSKYFTAGVFLGVGLLHMLPESDESLREAGTGRISATSEFPVAFAACALGFVLIWYFERRGQVAAGGCEMERLLAVTAQAEKMGGGNICFVNVETVASYGPVSCSPATVPADARPSLILKASNGLEGHKQALLVALPAGHPHALSDDLYSHLTATSASPRVHTKPEHCKSCSSHGPSQTVANECTEISTERVLESGQSQQQHDHKWSEKGYVDVEGGSNMDACTALHRHTHDAKHRHVVLQGHGGMSYWLAGLFSLHSFVVGAALGASYSLEGTLSLLFALLAHKGAEAFSVGVEFVKEDVPTGKMIAVMLLYCAMTPLGICLGMAASLLQGPSGLLVANLVQAFGSGTVLYIVMHQLQDKADEKPVVKQIQGVLELLIFLSGVALMAVVSLYS